MQPTRSNYGTDQSQFGELYRPDDVTHKGTVVIVHGGFWRAQYGLALGRPLARDLAERGYVVWNLEYRRVGDGGGWPATFDDIARGVDHLSTLAVDTAQVVAVGHSAGGQLAVWAAGRPTLPAGSPGAAPTVRLTGAVSQAGVLDLTVAENTGVGAGAVADLIGGTPAKVPERYRLADPIQRLPLAVPVLCVHARGDENVPFAQSTAYVAAAQAAGDKAALHEVAGDHFTLIDPTTPAWAVVRDALPALLDGRLP
ncbi:alpha/beta hydrolase family protein [uncultured Jatrophihabitans sp.]|uniref:alpha/beta hydrolase family protein n=1 Tax=uncultured Jatrophihabitans sp. TaxID=1610747 RepID=UPI0035CA5678